MTLKEDRSVGLLPHLPAPCRYLRQPNCNLIALYLCAWPAKLNIRNLNFICISPRVSQLLITQWQMSCPVPSLTIAYHWISPSWHVVCTGMLVVKEKEVRSMYVVTFLKESKAKNGIRCGALRIKMGSHLLYISSTKIKL